MSRRLFSPPANMVSSRGERLMAINVTNGPIANIGPNEILAGLVALWNGFYVFLYHVSKFRKLDKQQTTAWINKLPKDPWTQTHQEKSMSIIVKNETKRFRENSWETHGIKTWKFRKQLVTKVVVKLYSQGHSVLWAALKCLALGCRSHILVNERHHSADQIVPALI